jgi:GT2 family glycosyltransferase
MKSDKEMGRAPSPRGAGLHFCAMLTKELFEDVGGFSEEYRGGQGYDDNDFLWKLNDAGASFRIMDNCVTDHVDCERCVWPKGGHKRNKEIFENKWRI